MSRLEEAMQLAENRKQAIFGDRDGEAELVLGTNDQGRAIFSGFDLDNDEMTEVVDRAGMYFTSMTAHVGLLEIFRACWTDAFLVGLMYSQTSAVHAPTAERPPGDDPDEDRPPVVGGQ